MRAAHGAWLPLAGVLETNLEREAMVLRSQRELAQNSIDHFNPMVIDPELFKWGDHACVFRVAASERLDLFPAVFRGVRALKIWSPIADSHFVVLGRRGRGCLGRGRRFRTFDSCLAHSCRSSNLGR